MFQQNKLGIKAITLGTLEVQVEFHVRLPIMGLPVASIRLPGVSLEPAPLLLEARGLGRSAAYAVEPSIVDPMSRAVHSLSQYQEWSYIGHTSGEP